MGWYTVKAGSEFSLQDIEAGSSFVQAIYDDPFQDPNFRLYAASVLSRVTNIGDFVDDEKISKITNLLISDPLSRVRAYAAVILSNLRVHTDAIIQSLPADSK